MHKHSRSMRFAYRMQGFVLSTTERATAGLVVDALLGDLASFVLLFVGCERGSGRARLLKPFLVGRLACPLQRCCVALTLIGLRSMRLADHECARMHS